MRPGPATSSPPCCPSASGSRAPSTPTPWPPATNLAPGPGRRGCGRGPRPVRRPAARPRAGPGRRAPRHPDHPPNLAYWTGQAGDAAGARDQFAALLPVRERVQGAEHPDTLTTRAQPRPLDRAGGGCGRGPRPVRRPAARPRAGPGRRAPRHPDHPRQPRLLDRAGGGCGRGPRPVRRPAARPRAGPGPRAPRHPDHPRQPRLLDRAGGGCGS